MENKFLKNRTKYWICQTSDLDKKEKMWTLWKTIFRSETYGDSHKHSPETEAKKCKKSCELGFADPANRRQIEKRLDRDENIKGGRQIDKLANCHHLATPNSQFKHFCLTSIGVKLLNCNTHKNKCCSMLGKG